MRKLEPGEFTTADCNDLSFKYVQETRLTSSLLIEYEDTEECVLLDTEQILKLRAFLNSIDI